MSTLVAGAHGDGVRILSSGSPVASLSFVGTIRGVSPLAVGGSNAPGVGYLKSIAGDVRGFTWKAPGSSTYGTTVFAPVTGDYVLEDGEDTSKWIRIHVDLSWLPEQPEEARVFLKDRWNALGPDDVDASEALSGTVDTVTFSLLNASPDKVRSVKVWLGAAHPGLEISPDNVTFTSPTTEGAAISIGDLAKNGTAALYVRRTIGAGATSDAAVLNQLELSWDGL